jgi:MFS family permease
MNSIIEEINPYGKYQKLLIILVGSMSMYTATCFYVTIFNTAQPDLVCRSLYENSSAFKETRRISNKTCSIWKNYTLSKARNESLYYTCHFDEEYYSLTIVNEWNLLCERQHLTSLTQTVFLVGSISGFLSGIVSDKYGRKLATIVFLFISSLSFIVCQILMSDLIHLNISTNVRYIIYCLQQLINGITYVCLYSSSYVLNIELTNDNYHTLFTNINIYFFILGELYVLAVFYFSRSWHIANWSIAIFSLVLLIVTVFTLPESPR